MAKLIETDMDFQEDAQKDKYLTFELGKECYGIDINYVTEIIGIQAITEIPEMPEYIKGIINLRGKIIPVMDVRCRFKKQYKEYNDRTCIIVVDMEELLVGLIVDSVAEVTTIPSEDVVEPPQNHMGIGNRYIKGIGKVGNAIKLLLDCKRLLAEDELEQITEAL